MKMGSSFHNEMNEMDVGSAHIAALIFNKKKSRKNIIQTKIMSNGFYLVLTSWSNTLKIKRGYVFKNILNFKLSSSFLSEEKVNRHEWLSSFISYSIPVN